MKKWLKIAMLIDWWNPIFWGGQIHVKELSNRLVKNHNCKIDLYVRKLIDKKWRKFNKNEELLGGKMRIFRVGPTTKFFDIFWRILSLILTTVHLLIKAKKEKYDIIHAHAYVSGIPWKIVSVILNIPIIYTVHGTMLLDARKKSICYYIEDFLVNKIKYNLEISVSKNIYKYNNKNKIIVIPNWVDIDYFNNVSQVAKYSWKNFIWVGRFDWQKWLKYLIEGINLIDRRLLDQKGFSLSLVWDGEDIEKITNLVNQFWLNKYIICKWKIFTEKLVEEYKQHQIFILPSLAEWQPLTVLEAFASKLPIIATNVWDNQDFINDSNWFLIWSADKYEIKNIIERVLGLHSSDLKKMWEAWYKSVKNQYTWDIMVERTFTNYLWLMK